MIWDPTTYFGILLVSLTNNITGSLYLSLLFLVLILLSLAASFRLPMIITIPAIIPLLIVSLTMTANFLPILGIAIFYVGIIFASLLFK